MATVLLSAAGAAVGSAFGGAVLGVSATAIGRFAGAALGRVIDDRLLSGPASAANAATDPRGQIDALRVTGSGEGRAIAQIFGRMKLGGHIIWASDLRQSVVDVPAANGSGTVQQYDYRLDLAIALCEGEIGQISRLWANEVELSQTALSMQVYSGRADQLPDPTIEAALGSGQVPAFRGTAYVVLQDFSLLPYGNRLPSFQFEVSRPDLDAAAPSGTIARDLPGVALMPGTGEYALATSKVHLWNGISGGGAANVTTPTGQADLDVSLNTLQAELPGVEAVSLIVSWFGDDLRCGHCQIQPKIEQTAFEGRPQRWSVSGVTRTSAARVPRIGDAPVYGATPSDASVIEAIAALRTRNKRVMYYPFILMDQIAGNGLPDPWGQGPEQPQLPWRGRITADIAPGRDKSPDQTADVDDQVAAFVGAATAGDFTVQNGTVIYTGPADDWGYARFILHQAALCAAAGGVHAFCIGSEMRALTQLRGGAGFPFVQALIHLAAQVRMILGPDCKLSYAADWSEYFGYHPVHEPGSVYFHLDPLWADPNIDFIGIDNYMPLSDWRDGVDHLDAGFGTIYAQDYLQGNIEGGEGYDWYYDGDTARDHQIRTPITDGQGRPWIWRYKDMRNWWANDHYDRVNGVETDTPSPWQPRSKPIWFTEIGCAAIDKGANQPNKFLDPKSVESALPHYSNGQRDELMPRAYFQAVLSYWQDETRNPVSDVYGGAMIDTRNIYAWAWDARPYPWFPARRDIWADAGNYATGHWLNGRSAGQPLARVVQQICARVGLLDVDTTKLYGFVRGYSVTDVASARRAIEQLMLHHGFDAYARGGRLAFISRSAQPPVRLSDADLVRSSQLDHLIEFQRLAAGEGPGRVRLRYLEADGQGEPQFEEAILPDDQTHAAQGTELPMRLTRAEARQTVARWLQETRLALTQIRFALPNSKGPLAPGDVVQIAGDSSWYRITGVEHGPYMLIDAVQTAPAINAPAPFDDIPPSLPRHKEPGPVTSLLLDLPQLYDGIATPAPRFAATAQPWVVPAVVYGASSGADLSLLHQAPAPARIGALAASLSAAPPGQFHPEHTLQVTLQDGALVDVDYAALLAGKNLAAIGDGSLTGWEVVQFQTAYLDGGVWQLRGLIRGACGTDAYIRRPWPQGSHFVLLDDRVQPIANFSLPLGSNSSLRIGPLGVDLDDPVMTAVDLVFDGTGNRPAAPVHLRQTGAQLSWIRRVAVGDDRWDLPEVPLPDGGAQYLLTIGRGDRILREATVAQLAYDLPDDLLDQLVDAEDGWWQVAQISSRFGVGASARSLLTSL